MIPSRLEHVLRADATPMKLARLFADAGFELYLVGGSVRDALLDRQQEGLRPGDYDFATGARPQQTKEIVAGWADDVFTVGEAFGTIGVLHGDNVLEITTFRSDVYRDESRKPVVEFSDNIETDVSRRDFTVNALALRMLPEPQMLDPYGGLTDLNEKVLRTPLDPEVSFEDDPLRMLRLYRFTSTLSFTPDPKAEEAVTRLRQRLGIVSSERIRDELSKLLLGDKVGAALWGLVRSGLAEEFIPEVPALGVEQDPLHRHKHVLAHTIAVVEKCPPDLVVRLAALFHDVGKPATREMGKEGVTFHHHEVVGARMTKSRLRALRYSKQESGDVARLVYLHMRPHTYKMGWTDRAVRRYVRDAEHLLEPLNALVRCDVTTRDRQRARAIGRRIDELERRIAELRTREELERLRPPIDGHQVMEFLGIEPGPKVGEAIEMLTEHRIDEGPYTEEEAFVLLRRWAGEQGLGVP
ncbi:MAG: CCA tRNA nucleotidyltransferase [Acidimicrobiia bacterium]